MYLKGLVLSKLTINLVLMLSSFFCPPQCCLRMIKQCMWLRIYQPLPRLNILFTYNHNLTKKVRTISSKSFVLSSNIFLNFHIFFLKLNYKFIKNNQILIMNITFATVAISKILIFFFLIALATSQSCNTTNCQSCNTTTTEICLTCLTGYKLVGPSCCNTSLNCGSCLDSSQICQNCTSNSFCLSNQTCISCGAAISQCSTCANCTACLTCKSTFVVNSTSECQLCSQFMDLCKTCSNMTVCTGCVNNSYAVNSTSKLCQTCGSFISRCTKCSNRNTCTTCEVSPNFLLYGGKCPYCNSVIPNCLNCTSYYFCTVCNQYYAIKLLYGKATCEYCSTMMTGCLDCTSATSCIKCSVGCLVIGGCSTVPGCASVNQTGSRSICMTCNFPQFQYQAVNGTCVCRYGHLAGNYCTDLAGCINVARNNSTDTCTNCNSAAYFVLSNSSCQCQPYFQPNGTTCAQICGDGRRYILACDDGNTVSGDGCSSVCKVEKGYICKDATTNGISMCAYKGRFILTLKCINNLGSNTGNIVFLVSPSLTSFGRSNLDGLIKFNATENCTMTSYSLAGSTLTIYFSFQIDVENTDVQITLKYDSNYVISPDYTTSFKLVECNGNKLLVGSNFSDLNKSMVDVFTQALVALLWISFFLGSYSHKMIGVETLHTIQLIFIIQVLSQHYTPVVTYFNALNYSLNAYQRIITKSSIVESAKYYLRLHYSASFIDDASVVFMLELLTFILYIVLTIKKKMMIDQAAFNIIKVKPRFSIQQITHMQQLLYRFLVFPLIAGTYYHFILSLMTHSKLGNASSKVQQYSSSLASFFMTMLTFLILFNQWKSFILPKLQPEPIEGAKDYYIPLYLTNMFFLSIISYLCLSQMITTYAIYVFSAALFMNASTLIVFWPYRDKIHNLGMIINQAVIFSNIGWIISQEYILLAKRYEEIIAFVNTALIGIVVLYSFIRIIFEINNKKTQTIITVEFIKSSKNALDRKREMDELARMILKQNEVHLHEYGPGFQIVPNDKTMSIQKGYDDLVTLKSLRYERKKILRRQLLQKKLCQDNYE